MCVYSMVMDHYQPQIPDLEKIFVPNPVHPPPLKWDPVIEGKKLSEWRKLIEEFKAAEAAAKVVDKLTSQPDCEDPKKATLVERVAMLEKRLDEIAEHVGA